MSYEHTCKFIPLPLPLPLLLFFLFTKLIPAPRKSLDIVYIIGVPANVLSLLFALFISNINIKRKPETDTETSVPQSGNATEGEQPATSGQRTSTLEK